MWGHWICMFLSEPCSYGTNIKLKQRWQFPLFPYMHKWRAHEYAHPLRRTFCITKKVFVHEIQMMSPRRFHKRQKQNIKVLYQELFRKPHICKMYSHEDLIFLHLKRHFGTNRPRNCRQYPLSPQSCWKGMPYCCG